MKRTRLFSVLLAAAMLAGAFTGCSPAEEQTSSAPGSDGEAESITLNVMCPAWDVTVPKAEQWMWQEYEKMTGVHVEWEEVSQAAMSERKSTMMASNELPDIFWQYFAFSGEELSVYGSQGVFVSLDDKTDKTPNLTALLDGDPALRSAVTMPDGHIYAFPYVTQNQPELTCRYYINKGYLSELGMDTVETVDDFEAYLRGVKNLKTLDGEDIYPFYDSPHTWWFTEMQLVGSYGMGDNGFQQYQMMVYNPGDDQLKFMFTDDKMKELWQRVATWYQEGLLYPGTFAVDYDYSKWVADGIAGKVGSFTWSSASYLYAGAEKDFIGINSLEGPYGRVTSWADTPSRTLPAGIITSSCESVDRALEWLDFWYSEEGSLFGYAGVEGVTYTKNEDGTYSYTDDITSYDGGIQLGAYQKGLLVYGGNYPFLEPADMTLQTSLFGTTFEGMYGCTEEDIAEYYPEEVWPAFVATTEEIDILNTCFGDIQTYVNESRIKFLTGEWNFEEDWDAYVEMVNSIHLDEYLALKQTQFERYRANMQ